MRRARGWLAQQDARARTSSSSGAFAGECAEQPTENRKLCTEVRRCRGLGVSGSRGGTPSLLFFCRRFLFQIKRKCRNAGSIYRLIMVCSEGRNQLATIQPYYNFVSASPISDSRKGCPYEVRCLKFVRGSRADDIRPYTIVLNCNIAMTAYYRHLHTTPIYKTTLYTPTKLKRTAKRQSLLRNYQ